MAHPTALPYVSLVKITDGADNARELSIAADGSLAVTGVTIATVLDGGPASGIGTMSAPVHGDMSTAVALTAAAGAGLKWVITDIIISAAVNAEIQLQEETSATVVFGPLLMAANTTVHFQPRSKLKLATAVKKVMGKSSGADHVTIQVGGYTEA